MCALTSSLQMKEHHTGQGPRSSENTWNRVPRDQANQRAHLAFAPRYTTGPEKCAHRLCARPDTNTDQDLASRNEAGRTCARFSFRSMRTGRNPPGGGPDSTVCGQKCGSRRDPEVHSADVWEQVIQEEEGLHTLDSVLICKWIFPNFSQPRF